MMKSLLIRNGQVINASSDLPQGKLDILVEDGKIVKIAKEIPAADHPDAETIDATGQWVMPGFVDMHVHLREPGQEYKEDIESGTWAAVHGGFTGVVCMPNTSPVVDDPSLVTYIKTRAAEVAHCHVYPSAAVTKGSRGEELTEMGLLLQAGAVAFTDDGRPVASANRMRLAMQYASNFDALIMEHCEEPSLSAGGCMHEGYTSVTLGLKGIPGASEDVMVARNVLLAESYGARLHICHLSTARSAEIVRQAKARGVRVSCETAPHYFAATDEWVARTNYNANTKMYPPLRSGADVEGILAALADGTIDAIATDHAPHHIDEKLLEFDAAMNGIVGLETAFSLAVTHLVKPGIISPERLVQLMSHAPCELLKLPGGKLAEGEAADITIADPEADVVYTAESLHSKSKNSPFLDQPYFGKITQTVVNGHAAL